VGTREHEDDDRSALEHSSKCAACIASGSLVAVVNIARMDDEEEASASSTSSDE